VTWRWINGVACYSRRLSGFSSDPVMDLLLSFAELRCWPVLMGCSGCGQQGAVGCLVGSNRGLVESDWTSCPEQDTWTKIWGWFSIGPQPEPNLELIKASWSTVICFHPLPLLLTHSILPPFAPYFCKCEGDNSLLWQIPPFLSERDFTNIAGITFQSTNQI